GPRDRASSFATGAWLASHRPTSLVETRVNPGDTGTFEFPITAPATSGSFFERFNIVAEGDRWMNDIGLGYAIKVVQPSYTWALSGQAAYVDSSKTVPVDLNNLSPGQTAWFVLRATNTGNVSWTNTGAHPVRLGTEGPKDRPSRYRVGSWLAGHRPSALIESSVSPGQVGSFEFPIEVPPGGGVFLERFNLVAEGFTWMNDMGFNYHTRVNGSYAWAPVNQYAYTDNTKTISVDLSNLSPGQTVFIGFTARNTGNAVWYQGGAYPVRTGTSRPLERISAFAAPSWLWNRRPSGLVETSISPGQLGTFEFEYTAPLIAGTYHEYFQPLAEHITWMNDPGLHFYTVVQ
ncbi:MAG TPA: hypothetical protein VF272_03540, partial [Candidatus Saccharimonadia bacterium]